MDDDDLDELLDEVEKKFCRNVNVCSLGREESIEDRKDKHCSDAKQNRTRSSDTEDIDSFLEELLEDDDGTSTSAKTEQFKKGDITVKKLSTQSGGRKCCPVFIGGSSVTNGVGTSTSKRSCDQLRCTSCDFRVLAFDDCDWDSSCDYLFLRNNMPDRQKLKSKLKTRRSFRSYCCQCSWVSTSDVADLTERPQLRWVCGKHHN